MNTIEKIYPSEQVYEITQKTSRLFTNKGEQAVNKYCEQYNFKKRYCFTCKKETLTIRAKHNCICVCCNQSVAMDETEKEIIQNMSWTKFYQMTQDAGYDDLDIKGYGKIRRAKVPHELYIGDIFNIYFGESSKNDCLYLGTLDESLTRHAKILELKEQNGNQELEKDYLCQCNNCGAIMRDENPQTDATKYELTDDELFMERLFDEDTEEHYWACPNCQTDDYLQDI